MDSSKKNSPDTQNLTWRLGDNIDVIEAQFVLGDFCLNHFPDNPQFARSIQNTDSISGIRNALKPITHLIITQRSDLTDEFTSLVHAINQTTA
ncbi:MAG TPA: hypothetical protein VIM35_08545 [Gallionella sp.]